MVRAADGTVWCWGLNVGGQDGHDPASNPSCPAFDGSPCSLPSPVTDYNGNAINSAAYVNVGAASVCYLTFTSDRAIWCLGTNQDGNLGNGTVVDDTPHFYPLPQMTGPHVGLDGEGSLLCATGTDAGVSCWGAAVDLALGEAGAALAQPCTGVPCVAFPVPIAGLSDVVTVAAGGVTGIALRRDGTLWAWGGNLSGTLGHPPGPDAGDVPCDYSGSMFCNATPSRILGLP